MSRSQVVKLCGFFCFTFLIVLPSALNAQTATWTRFRGDMGNGIAEATPPVEWTADKNFKWQTELPGTGWSSPVYADGRIWITSAITIAATPEEIAKKLEGKQFAQIKTAASKVEFHALCVDLETGNLLHDIVVGSSDDPAPINPMNSYASPTPAIAGGRVVCHFGSYGTWCLNAETGEKLWEQQFVIDHSVGPGSSPVIVGNNVILVCDGCDQQFIAAVDLSTGEPKWKTDRPPIRADNGEFKKSYCTPLVAEIDGKLQAVITGAQWICGYDPESGQELWRLDYGDGFSISAMPVVTSGLVVFNTGYGDHNFIAFKPEGSGEQEPANVVWRGRNGPSMASMVVHEDTIYSVTDRGALKALNGETGEELAKERRLANVSSSPLLAGGHLYIGNRDGKFMVVKCDDELSVVSEFDFGSGVFASPCVYENDLIIRTATEIIRIAAE